MLQRVQGAAIILIAIWGAAFAFHILPLPLDGPYWWQVPWLLTVILSAVVLVSFGMFKLVWGGDE